VSRAEPASKRQLQVRRVGATVYHAFVVDAGAEIHDATGRPMKLNLGRLIEPIFTGA
jgi:hypothetical protein